MVLFRLLCPFSFESVLSLIPEGTRGIPQSIALKEYKNVTVWSAADAAEWAGDDVLNGGIGTVYVPMNSQETGTSEVVNAWYQVWLLFWGYLWLAGIAAMVIYSVVCYLKLRSKLIGAAPLRDNIYLADHSNRADRKISTADLNGNVDDIIAANDTVVQYRLVTSTEGMEAFWT